MKVEHGGNAGALAESLGYRLEDCLDFSANINPLGLSPALRAGLIEAIDSLVHYPDIDYSKSRQFLADYHGLDRSNVLLANGAVEIFYELARYFKPEKLVTLSPTFMEYEKAFQQQGSQIGRFVLQGPDYSWTFDDLLPSLEPLSQGDAVLICNPNNPTGSLVTNAVLTELAGYLLEKGAILILDEAFIDFLEDQDDYSFQSYLKAYPNTVIVRSLTKFYAIPGLRLGYALSCHPACFQEIEGSRAPWTVNSLADQVLPLLLTDRAYQEQTRQWLKTEQDFLYQGLAALPQLAVVRPSANYIFFEYQGQLDLRAALWQRKIFIRSCQNYHDLGPNHYRIAIRSRQENEQLLQALRTVLSEVEPNEHN